MKSSGAGGDRMRRARAGGRSASERRARSRSPAGQGRDRRRQRKVEFKLGGSDMPDDPRMSMMRKMAGKRGGGSGQGGQGAGRGQGGDRPQAAKKRLGVARTERVKGIDNKGPTVKQVFVDAAKKGFAKKGWRKVYAEYSEVAEDMIAREGLPVGRKQLVRRYFELIRPRGGGGTQ